MPLIRRKQSDGPRTLRGTKIPAPPKPEAWSQAEVLTPVTSPLLPPLVSDGAGLEFAPEGLTGATIDLDPRDPAAQAVAKQAQSPGGWRELARTENEVLFSRGTPPEFLTVMVRKQGRRWKILEISREPLLRASRGGIRASSWRVDPNYPPTPEDTELQLLVTEQTFATGKLAHGRLLAPDIHLGSDQIVLRCYVEPLSGWQNRNVMNRETPVTVVLPEALGERELIDGAVYAPAPSS